MRWLARARGLVPSPFAIDVSPLAVDVAIAVVVYAATVYPSVGWSGRVRWDGVALAALASLPLVWRRRAPILVALLTGVGTTALSLLQALPDLPYGQLVATYTIAELGTPVWRFMAVVATVVGVAISLTVPNETLDTFGYVGLTFVTAYALGAGVRARRDRITMLEERTRRLTEQQKAVTAQERSRIARDMHDVLAHSVGLMVVQAEGGAAIVNSDRARAVAAFEAIAETGREALVQLRHTLGVLKESEPAQPGLDGLELLLRRTRNTGLDARLVASGTPVTPPPRVGATAYRLVQEALTNVVKHAGARRVTVTLEWLGDRLRLTVTDDGRGPRAAGVDGHGSSGHGSSGHGLIGMRERVAACDGELQTGPGPDGIGFRVRASLPIG